MLKLFTAAATALLIGTMAANATPVTGTYQITSSDGATITNLLGSGSFSLNLALNTPQVFDLANIFEVNWGTPGNPIVSTETVTFNFTNPTVLTRSITGTDSDFRTSGGTITDHDTLTWANGGLLTANFLDGSIVTVLLGNESYGGHASDYAGLTVPVTFTLTQAGRAQGDDPAPVPEPLTLSVLSAGLLGMAGLRRRAKAKA